MVRRYVEIMTDDLDGGEAAETVKFSLDGVSYEIDLSDPNAEALRTVLAPYIGAGRKMGRMVLNAKAPRMQRDQWLDTAARMPRNVRETDTTKEERSAIREWAAQHGVAVRDRGRVREHVIKAYRAKDPTIMGVEPVAVEPVAVKAVAVKAAQPPAKAAKKAAAANGSANGTKATGRKVSKVTFQPAGA